jgi:hypothetical protein
MQTYQSLMRFFNNLRLYQRLMLQFLLALSCKIKIQLFKPGFYRAWIDF